MAQQYVSDYEVEGEVPLSTSTAERAQGVVKFFNPEKGFGFCRREGGQSEVFIHANELRRSGLDGPVQTGDHLEFDVIAVPGKSPKAVNLRRVTA